MPKGTYETAIIAYYITTVIVVLIMIATTTSLSSSPSLLPPQRVRNQYQMLRLKPFQGQLYSEVGCNVIIFMIIIITFITISPPLPPPPPSSIPPPPPPPPSVEPPNDSCTSRGFNEMLVKFVLRRRLQLTSAFESPRRDRHPRCLSGTAQIISSGMAW